MYISAFAISGYRSLVDVKITDMRSVSILHGLNNTGKSNILSALETIFERKLFVEETETPGDVTKHERKGNFWQGKIRDFRDNFYQGKREDITFTVSVAFENGELSFLKDVLGKLAAHLAKPTY